MTYYVCKQCNYKHTFLPLSCAKCKGTNFYPLITSDPTGNTSICNEMEIQEDVLKLRIENEQLKEEIKDWKSCHEHQLKLMKGSNNKIADLEKQIEKMKCCENCDHPYWNAETEAEETICDNCVNHSNWKLKE